MREDQHGRGEAVATEVRGLPDVEAAVGGEFGRERTAVEGATAVAGAVGADEGDGRAVVAGAEVGGVAGAEGREVQGGQFCGIGEGGGANP